MIGQNTRRFSLILCQVILKLIAAESGFHETPSNIAAVVGQEIQMTCRTNPNETTQWSFSNNGGRTYTLVYNGQSVPTNFTRRFSVEKSTGIGHRNLKIKNIIVADAGIYKCVVLSRDMEGRSTPLSATAELIVLESDPVCYTNISSRNGSIIELDYIVFRCAVNFSGQYMPSMQWSEEEYTFKETPISRFDNMSDGIQQISSVTGLQVGAENNGNQITCKTQFSDATKKVHYTNATNVPNYLFRWNTKLSVHFATRNVSIGLQKSKYRQEDVLNCTATGNPSPSYRWKNVTTNETIATGPQLFLYKAKIFPERSYTIECVAENRVAGEMKLSSTVINVHVQLGHTTVSEVKLFYFTISAGILCAMLFVVVIVVGRERLRGLIVNFSTLFRRGPDTEPDVLPGRNQNDEDELELHVISGVLAEEVALENANRQQNESELGSRILEEGASAFHSDRCAKSFPVYAEVNKYPSRTLVVDSKLTRNEYATQEFRDDNPQNTPASKLSIGFDGIVYEELKSDESHYQSQASGSFLENPMFNKSEYARIDHTMEAPLPPQKD